MSHSTHPELYQRAETQTRNADGEAVDRVSWCDAGGRAREDRGVRRQTRHRLVHHWGVQGGVCPLRALKNSLRVHSRGDNLFRLGATATSRLGIILNSVL